MSDGEAQVRIAGPAEIPAVLGLWREANESPGPTDSGDALRLLLERDPESLLVAEADGEVVGSLVAAWDGWRGSFYRLAVHPGWRRRGVATRLVRAGEARLEALGAARLIAVVDEAHENGGDDLWRSLGYERQSHTRRFVRMLE